MFFRKNKLNSILYGFMKTRGQLEEFISQQQARDEEIFQSEQITREKFDEKIERLKAERNQEVEDLRVQRLETEGEIKTAETVLSNLRRLMDES